MAIESPRMDTPQPLWATCSSVWSHASKDAGITLVGGNIPVKVSLKQNLIKEEAFRKGQFSSQSNS